MEEGLNYFLSQNYFELIAICFVKDVLYGPKPYLESTKMILFYLPTAA